MRRDTHDACSRLRSFLSSSPSSSSSSSGSRQVLVKDNMKDTLKREERSLCFIVITDWTNHHHPPLIFIRDRLQMLFSPSILLSRLTFYSSTSSYPRAGERDQSKAGKRAEQSNIRDHSSPVSSSDSSCFLFYSPLPLHPIFWRERERENSPAKTSSGQTWRGGGWMMILPEALLAFASLLLLKEQVIQVLCHLSLNLLRVKKSRKREIKTNISREEESETCYFSQTWFLC